MLTNGRLWCKAMLVSAVAFLCGFMEADQQIKVNDDASVSIRGTIKIDPQYEASALPAMKKELPKKLPPGARLDFSQRIDGKAAVVIEAEGAAAAAMLKEDGSTTITVSDGGFMKRRYEYRAITNQVPPAPFPSHATITLPGSIESVLGGKKTANDTAEFDLTHAKRGDVIVVTSTAFAFSMGGGGANAAAVANPGMAAWLIPASIGSICAGAALLLAGWFRSRRATRSIVSPPIATAPSLVASGLAPVEQVASVFCTECGAPNAAGRKFCGKCGHALG